MRKRSFVNGAIILMIAGFVVRMLGFVYRVYLSNLIGAEGMGLFQLILPVYSMIIITLTSGISVSVSKMVAEEYAKNHIANLRRITSLALSIVLVSGIIISAAIFINLDFFVNTLLKDSRTYYSLMLLIPCIPIIAAASAIRGYFYGVQDIVPTAVSQVVEQVVKIGFVMAAIGWVANRGLEYACAVAILGMALGEISNLAVVYTVYKIKGRKEKARNTQKGIMRKREILRKLMSMSVPISFNRFITTAMAAAETILIPWRLLVGGMNYQQSLEVFGKLTGMAMPVLFFPTLITASLATTLVPAISEAVSLKNLRIANYRISKSIQFSTALGFIFTALFISYSSEISYVIYTRENIGPILYNLAFTAIFMYLLQTLSGILNGLGKQGISLVNSIVGYAIRISFVYFAIPIYGIDGFIWGIFISSVIVCTLNLLTVIKFTGVGFDLNNWVLKPAIIGIIIIWSSKYIYSFFSFIDLQQRLVIALTLLANMAFALFLMIIIGIIKKHELKRVLGVKRYK